MSESSSGGGGQNAPGVNLGIELAPFADAMLAAIPLPLVVVAPDSTLLAANEVARVLLGSGLEGERLNQQSWWRSGHVDRALAALNASTASPHCSVPVGGGQHTSWFTVSLSSFPVAKGRAVLLSFAQLTERSRGPFSRDESEAKFRGLFASMSEGVVVARVLRAETGVPVLRIEECNDALRRLLELGPQVMLPTSAESIFGADAAAVATLCGAVERTARASTAEIDWGVPARVLKLSAFPIGRGLVAALVSDLTEERAQQQELSRRILEVSDEASGLAVSLKTEVTRRRKAQNALRHHLALQADHLRELTCLYEVARALTQHDDDLDEVLLALAASIQRVLAGTSLQARISLRGRDYPPSRSPLGSPQITDLSSRGERVGAIEVGASVYDGKPVEVSPSVQSLVAAVAAMVSRALDQRQAMLDLQTSEARHRELVTEIAEGMFMADADGRLTFCNPAFARIHGRGRPEELLGCSLLELAPPEVRESLAREFAAFLESDEVMLEMETRINRPGDAEAFGRSRFRVDKRDGHLLAIRGLVEDTTARRRAELRVREQESYFKALFEHSQIGIAISRGAGGPLLEVNRTFCNMVGYTAEELLKLSLDALTHPEDRWLQASQRQQSGTQSSGRFQTRLFRKDGSVIWVNAAHSMLNNVGQLPVHLVVMEDVTRRTQVETALRESETRLFQILDSIPAGIVVLRGSTGDLYFANQTAFSMLASVDGGSAQEPAQSRVEWGRLRSVATRQPYDIQRLPLSAALGGERTAVDDLVLLAVDGSEVALHASASPIFDKDGQVEFAVGVFVDITDLRTMQSRLQDALVDVERSNKDLEQFAYVASHDLQEPLRMVASFTELLAEHLAHAMDDTAREFAGFAVDGAMRMQRLISDLLAYSRSGRDPQLRPMSLHAALESALLNLRQTIEETGARIDVSPLPQVIGDMTLLTQVLQNLLSNALKFGGDKPPQVTISAARDGDRWRIAVEDRGIGFDMRFSEKIFDVFQRLHNRDERRGTGIGLAICKRAIERHGGRIWAESSVGTGSTFFLTLAAVGKPEQGGTRAIG